jgi:hypothetical protein
MKSTILRLASVMFAIALTLSVLASQTQVASAASPSTPILSSPANNSSWPQSTIIELKWNSVAGATGYKVELWGGPYTTMVPCNWISGTSCWIGTMWPGTMYWHVKARDASGEGDWSDTWSFVIQNGGNPPPTGTPPPIGGGTPPPVPPTYEDSVAPCEGSAQNFEWEIPATKDHPWPFNWEHSIVWTIPLASGTPITQNDAVHTQVDGLDQYSKSVGGEPVSTWTIQDHDGFSTGPLALSERQWRILVVGRTVDYGWVPFMGWGKDRYIYLKHLDSYPDNYRDSLVYLMCKKQVTPTSYDQFLPILKDLAIDSPTPGAQLSYQVEIPDWMSYIQTSLNVGSKATVTLIAPDGTVYSPTSSGVTYTDTPGFVVHTLNLDSPKGGTWQVVVNVISAESDSVFMLNVYGKQINVSSNDNIPPVTGMHVDGTKGQNGWFVSDAAVTLSAQDNPGGSGVKGIDWSADDGTIWQQYGGPFKVSQEGISYVLARSYDNAENYDQSPIGKYLQIDKTPPVVNISTDQPQYTRVQLFVVHFSGYDPVPGSGLASLAATFNGQNVSDGQSIDMFWWNLGQYTLTAKGADFAGWTTTSGKTIKLIATIQSMQQTVSRLCKENYITQQGVCNSLQQKLNSALAAQQRGQNSTAVNIVLALQNEITAQNGKAVSVKAYSLLMMDSNYVITTLGGKK